MIQLSYYVLVQSITLGHTLQHVPYINLEGHKVGSFPVLTRRSGACSSWSVTSGNHDQQLFTQIHGIIYHLRVLYAI